MGRKRRQRRARRTVRRVARSAPKKVRRVVRRATRDNKITRKEIRKITKSGASRKVVSRVTRKANNTRGIKSVNKKRALNIRKKVRHRHKNKGNPIPVRRGNGGNRGGNRGNQGISNKPVGVDIKGPKKNPGKVKKTWDPDGGSSYYKNFKYKRAIGQISKQEKARDKKERFALNKKKFRRIDVKDKELKKLAKSTGFNKIKNRIGADGRLKVNKKKLKKKYRGNAPSFKKFKRDRKDTQSPYASRFQKLGKKLGVKYGNKARKNRTRSRLSTLTKRLNPDQAFSKTKLNVDNLETKGKEIVANTSTSI